MSDVGSMSRTVFGLERERLHIRVLSFGASAVWRAGGAGGRLRHHVSGKVQAVVVGHDVTTQKPAMIDGCAD